ncbi:hypothetical protein EUTSA_v10028265mg [Eutrema salsugineum]|uniref:F-box associated beta-propeller type 1 domain-containing protein n=2 Tax=Eutrema salsugineum TaxID=72664 RepID=V4LSH4_EUTSA|nr:hypothetical protein EUTSA_v10028265mg [Eutrema salsugineum]
MNSLATMDENVFLDIISHCPSTEIAKFRLLNKACNKRSYEFFFVNRHLRRTNSVFGYFIQSYERFKYRYRFVSGVEEEAPENNGISLEFLPSKDVKIEACDTRNGIMLCVDDSKYKGGRRIPDYIVCKPATKQYRIIPNPKTRYFTIATGLVVIQSNPFRYKIVRVSNPNAHERKKTKEGFYNLNCEVFDSDSFAWKRLNDLELSWGEFLGRSDKPVLSYGFLHWLTTENNVIRFCMRTESWSLFPVPDGLAEDRCLALVSYEGKLGLLISRDEGDDDGLWVLEGSFGKSWVNVKDVKISRAQGRSYVKPLWFPSSDVVSVVGCDRLGFYNMNSKKSRYLHMTTQGFFRPYDHLAKDYFIPFYSNKDNVGLNNIKIHQKRSDKRKDKKKKSQDTIR